MEISGVSGSSSYDQLQQLQLQTEKDKKAAEQTAAQGSTQVAATGAVAGTTAETAVQSTSQNVDTLEISAEGRAYQQQMQASPPPKDSSVSETSSTEDSEDSETTTVLTNLTEDEIDDLVDDGTITQAEANTELARRASLKEAEESQVDSEQDQENLYIENEE